MGGGSPGWSLKTGARPNGGSGQLGEAGAPGTPAEDAAVGAPAETQPPVLIDFPFLRESRHSRWPRKGGTVREGLSRCDGQGESPGGLRAPAPVTDVVALGSEAEGRELFLKPTEAQGPGADAWRELGKRPGPPGVRPRGQAALSPEPGDKYQRRVWKDGPVSNTGQNHQHPPQNTLQCSFQTVFKGCVL